MSNLTIDLCAAARRKGSLILTSLIIVVAFQAISVQAADFWAIIANLNNADDPQAFIDISVDARVIDFRPYPLTFDVFKADGTLLRSFEVMTNERGFATTATAVAPNDNLFNISQGRRALVHVTVSGGIILTAARLHQTLGRAEFVSDIVPLRHPDGTSSALGRVFDLDLGDIDRGATLLVGNVGGSDVNVDIFIGTGGADGNGKYNQPRLENRGIWILHFDESDANSNIVIKSTGDVFVQFAVESTKRSISEYLVMPL